jgi:microcystin-dependent protein
MSIYRRRQSEINKTLYYSNKINAIFKPVRGIVQELMELPSPTGSITAYTMSTAPEGWLICDGAEISRDVYADLFSVIGTTFGSGDNLSTFNLPNYQGAFLRGTGTQGNYSGPALNTSQNHATQIHTHSATSTVSDPGHAHTQYSINDDFNNSGGNVTGNTPSFAASDGAGTRTWPNINSNSTGITVATTIANSSTNTHPSETRPYNYGVYWIIKY